MYFFRGTTNLILRDSIMPFRARAPGIVCVCVCVCFKLYWR